MLCIDFTVCNTIIAMYCRRLIIYNERQINRIMSHQNSHLDDNDDESESQEDCDFTSMAKSTVLTLVSCLSTQIAILCWTVMGSASMWAAIDSAVNCWCIVLLFELYENLFRLYSFCCCLCHRMLCYECIRLCSYHCLCKVQDGGKDVVMKAQPETELTTTRPPPPHSGTETMKDVLIVTHAEEVPCDNARETESSQATSSKNY